MLNDPVNLERFGKWSHGELPFQKQASFTEADMIASKIGKRCLNRPRSGELYVNYIMDDLVQMPKNELSSDYVFKKKKLQGHTINCHKGV